MNDTPDHDPKLLPALTAGGSVRPIIPQDFDGVWRMAKAVVAAGMAPKDMATAEKITIAVLHGMEVGLSPMVALQSIAVINGRPTLWGDGALGLVQASGKIQSIKEWSEGDGDAKTAYCRIIRKGDPEPKLGQFSIADAKKAGLWQKKGRDGQPTPWVTYEDRMLKMRARAFALRDSAADVLKGLGIAEEVRDTEPAVAIAAPDPDRGAAAAPKPPAEAPLPAAPISAPDPGKGVEAKAQPINAGQPKEAAPDTKRKTEAEVPATSATSAIDERSGFSEGGFTDKVEDAVIDNGDVDESEPITPQMHLDELDTNLGMGKDQATLSEVWEVADLEATFTQLPDADRWIGLARGIMRRHQKRVKESG